MRTLHIKTNFNCTIAIKSWSVTLNAQGAACLKNRLINPQSLVYFFKLISTYAYKCCTLCSVKSQNLHFFILIWIQKQLSERKSNQRLFIEWEYFTWRLFKEKSKYIYSTLIKMGTHAAYFNLQPLIPSSPSFLPSFLPVWPVMQGLAILSKEWVCILVETLTLMNYNKVTSKKTFVFFQTTFNVLILVFRHIVYTGLLMLYKLNLWSNNKSLI